MTARCGVCINRPGRTHLSCVWPLSDEYGNALLTEWDEHGRLVGLHDEPRAIDVTLRYEDERFPQRVTAASHFDGNQTWPLMQWRYDARGSWRARRMPPAW
jgi:hypothetical protein